MKTRYAIAAAALVACLGVGGATRATTAAGAPTRTAVASPGTLWAQKAAYDKAGRDREATAAAAHPAPSPRPVPALPGSCPRGLPSQSSIRPADTAAKVPGVGMALVTQATVVFQQELYYLSSGADRDQPPQGLIAVYHPVQDACAQRDQRPENAAYPAPGQHGAITLTAVLGETVTFRAADGTTGRFNVVTKQYLAP